MAGGAVINANPDSPRYSDDADIFHDAEERVPLSAEADAAALARAGFGIEWLIRRPEFQRAVISRKGQSLRLEWAQDGAFRFFPAQHDRESGWRLHLADLAARKTTRAKATGGTGEAVAVESDKGPSFEQSAVMTFRQFQPGTTEYEDALRLREAILRKPLGLALTEADRARDPDCFHLGGFEGIRLAAVLLLQPVDERTLQMRQVAVRRERQGSGIGSKLIAFAEEFARQHSYAAMIAHARVSAVEFYRRLGYTVSDEKFVEVTIPHRLVTKRLSASVD